MKIYRISNLVKKASLTLSPLRSDGEFNQEFTLLNVSHEVPFRVNKKIRKNWGTNDFNFTYDHITPDGGSEFSSEGIMNVYLHDQDVENTDRLKELLRYVLEAIKEDPRVSWVEFIRIESYGDSEHFKDIDETKLREMGITADKPRVARVKVIMDDSKRKEIVPEVNMANNNAFYLLGEVLGYKQDFWEDYVLDARNVLSRINYYLGEEEYPKEIGEDEPDVWGLLSGEESDGKEGIDFLSGRKAIRMYDDEKIRSQLKKIKEVCEWSLRNGIEKLTLS